MANFSFKYGDGHMDFSYPDEDIIRVIEPAHVPVPEGTDEEKVLAAIENPIGCGKLEEIVKPLQEGRPETTLHTGVTDAVQRLKIQRKKNDKERQQKREDDSHNQHWPIFLLRSAVFSRLICKSSSLVTTP